MIKTKTLEILNSTLKRCGERGLFHIPAGFEIQLEVPRVEAHGDFATNVALTLAKPFWQMAAMDSIMKGFGIWTKVSTQFAITLEQSREICSKYTVKN